MENNYDKIEKVNLYLNYDDVKDVLNGVNDIVQGGGSSHIVRHLLYLMHKKKVYAGNLDEIKINEDTNEK